MKDFLQKYKPWIIAHAILLLYLSPNIFLPHKAHYLIHDNLDSNVIWYKNLAESGKMFAENYDYIERTHGGLGIPRGAYPSQWNLMHWLYVLLPALGAYSFNAIIMHLFAFWGMFYLARDYFSDKENTWLNVGVATVFALLPFWPSGGLAIAGHPFLLWAFLNILNRKLNWYNWLIIAFIPFYSLLALANLFLIPILAICFLIWMIRRKEVNIYIIGALALFTLVSVFTEHRLLQLQFLDHFEHHRSDFLGKFGQLNWKGTILVTFLHFIKGHYHFPSLQFPIIPLFMGTAIVLVKNKKARMKLIALAGGSLLISLSFILPEWKALYFLSEVEFLRSISLRFYALSPLLWFVSFAYSGYLLVKYKPKIGNWIIYSGISLFILLEFFSVNDGDYRSSNFSENTFYNTFIGKKDKTYRSWENYYQLEMFEEVKTRITPGDYYIACLGFAPEIAQYHKYNTLGGYYYLYQKAYNEKLLEINKKELAKNERSSIGSRSYMVSKELEDNAGIILNLEWDFDYMIEVLHCKYVFSRLAIENKRLKPIQHFSNEQFDHQLYIYLVE